MYQFDPSLFRSTRKKLGMTQSELAQASGVSLPNIQIIESGKGNPSIKTLEAIAGALSLSFGFEIKKADWDALAVCGAPLMVEKLPKERRMARTLIRSMKECGLELSENRGNAGLERRKEAFQALLLALRDHYPAFFQKAFGKVPTVRAHLPKALDGRLIKLRRQALAVLGTYL